MACVETQITEDCCYVRFGDWPQGPAARRSRELGRTVRGERLIADVDAEGHIIGLELVGGTLKPCQTATVDATPGAE